MTETKFTPGPWKWLPDIACVRTTTIPSHEADIVADIPLGGDDEEVDEARLEQGYANGHLIAAAPDLYAACEAALRLTQTYPRPADDEGYRFSNQVTSACLAALAKARGEATS